MPHNLHPAADGLTPRERGFRVYGTMLHFVSLHLNMNGVERMPRSWDTMRDLLLASGANFGPPPKDPENYDHDNHEGHVAERYVDFRQEALASARTMGTEIGEQRGWPEEHIVEIVDALDDLLPHDSADFLDEVHKAWIVRDGSVSETLLLLRADPETMMEMMLGDGAGNMLKSIMNDIMPD